jgi:hypothetical protein
MKQLTDENDVEDVLKRYNIDPADYRTIREFQAAIRAKIGSLRGGFNTLASSYFQRTQFSFPKYDVNRITYTAYEQAQVRYIIPGAKGLFGYPKAAQYVIMRMEE